MVRETVDVRELGSRLTELLTLLEQGNEVTVVQDETPVARLLPPLPAAAERVPGLHRGVVWISDDFDEPLPNQQIVALFGTIDYLPDYDYKAQRRRQ